MAKRGPKSVTPEHKAAMERGRREGRIVRNYLEALRAKKPRRGPRRTPETVSQQLKSVESALQSANAVEELRLVQERRNLKAELKALTSDIDMEALEDAFIGVAKSYGERQEIEYASWREVGVPAAVLKRAGIGRS